MMSANVLAKSPSSDVVDSTGAAVCCFPYYCATIRYFVYFLSHEAVYLIRITCFARPFRPKKKASLWRRNFFHIPYGSIERIVEKRCEGIFEELLFADVPRCEWRALSTLQHFVAVRFGREEAADTFGLSCSDIDAGGNVSASAYTEVFTECL